MGRELTNAERVRIALRHQLERATKAGQSSLVVLSRDLHDSTNFTPGSHPNQMPTVCNIMHEFRQGSDKVLHVTPSGRSSTLKIE